jgi:hypothetical protein
VELLRPGRGDAPVRGLADHIVYEAQATAVGVFEDVSLAEVPHRVSGDRRRQPGGREEEIGSELTAQHRPDLHEVLRSGVEVVQALFDELSDAGRYGDRLFEKIEQIATGTELPSAGVPAEQALTDGRSQVLDDEERIALALPLQRAGEWHRRLLQSEHAANESADLTQAEAIQIDPTNALLADELPDLRPALFGPIRGDGEQTAL